MISSVGLEHYLDRVGVTGSNPVSPTMRKKIFFGSEMKTLALGGNEPFWMFRAISNAYRDGKKYPH